MGLTLNEYQKSALRTVNEDLEEPITLASFALGIAGEAGEVADLVKKHIGHGHPMNREHMAKELGDVLWYVATLASRMGYTLEEVAERNIAKLKVRYPEGFSSERSMNREG